MISRAASSITCRYRSPTHLYRNRGAIFVSHIHNKVPQASESINSRVAQNLYQTPRPRKENPKAHQIKIGGARMVGPTRWDKLFTNRPSNICRNPCKSLKSLMPDRRNGCKATPNSWALCPRSHLNPAALATWLPWLTEQKCQAKSTKASFSASKRKSRTQFLRAQRNIRSKAKSRFPGPWVGARAALTKMKKTKRAICCDLSKHRTISRFSVLQWLIMVQKVSSQQKICPAMELSSSSLKVVQTDKKGSVRALCYSQETNI